MEREKKPTECTDQARSEMQHPQGESGSVRIFYVGRCVAAGSTSRRRAAACTLGHVARVRRILLREGRKKKAAVVAAAEDGPLQPRPRLRGLAKRETHTDKLARFHPSQGFLRFSSLVAGECGGSAAAAASAGWWILHFFHLDRERKVTTRLGLRRPPSGSDQREREGKRNKLNNIVQNGGCRMASGEKRY